MINKIIIRIFVIAAIFVFILYIAKPDIPMLDIPPHIRSLIWAIFIITGILLLALYLQPTKPPANVLPGPGNEWPGNEETSGTVVEYGNNSIGDIDKILLQRSSGRIWLHFPPHTASEVIHIGVRSTTVRVTIEPGVRSSPNNIPLYELNFIQSSSLGKAVYIHDIPPPSPIKGNEITVSGHEVQFRLDEHGKVAAFILADKLIDLNPVMAETLVPLLRQANEIIVKGYERGTNMGFVNTTGLALIKPYTITIDKTNYLLP